MPLYRKLVTGPQGPQGPVGPQGPSGITKRVETYTGTTNASGLVTFTFSTPFAVAPHVSPEMNPALSNVDTIRINSISTTGCQVGVTRINAVTVLGISVLSASPSGVNGCNVSIVVVER